MAPTTRSEVRRALASIAVLGMLAVSEADRSLMASGRKVVIINGDYLVKDGAAAWSKSVIDPTLSYPAVNTAFDEAIENFGIGGGGISSLTSSPPWYPGALGQSCNDACTNVTGASLTCDDSLYATLSTKAQFMTLAKEMNLPCFGELNDGVFSTSSDGGYISSDTSSTDNGEDLITYECYWPSDPSQGSCSSEPDTDEIYICPCSAAAPGRRHLTAASPTKTTRTGMGIKMSPKAAKAARRAHYAKLANAGPINGVLPFARLASGITTVANSGNFVFLGGAAPSLIANKKGTPTLLMSYDDSYTFQKVTGLEATTAAEAYSGAFGAFVQGGLPYPATSPMDITSITFTSRSTGFAVGGQVAYALPQSASVKPGTGSIMMTTNGGTIWRSIKLYPTISDIAAAYAQSDAAGAAVYSQPFPGALLSVASTSSGKYLWAVGAPPTIATATTGALTTLQQPGSNTAVEFVQQVYPTILYSANGGFNWQMQTAPALFGGVAYALLSVYVATGSTAVAVGGGLNLAASGGQSGVILRTANGGFSWGLAGYPGNTGKAPVFNYVTLAGKNQLGWAVGMARTDDYYPTTVSTDASGNAVSGTGYSVLVSTNGGASWTSPPINSFPAGFVISAKTLPPTSLVNVYGMSWSNNMVGWMYGERNIASSSTGFIYSTTNGGITWVDETPNDVVVGKNAGPVYIMM